ncbi:MAG TPA: RDD family protein [Ginsengibacter sp.]
MIDLLTPESFSPLLANKGKRYVAIVIDYTVYFAFYWLIVSFFGETYTTNDGVTHYDVNGFPALACFAFWFIIPITEGFGGQSFGKLLCKIKVVKVNYDEAGLGQCIVRHLFDMVDFFPLFGIVGLLVASNNPLRQRVGDLVAKTIVVEK